MNNAPTLLYKAFTGICISLLLMACEGSQMNDLTQFVAEAKARKPGRIAPLPEIKPIETFIYTAADRRNPFTDSLGGEEEESMEVPSNGIQPDRDRRKEELEAVPLDSIRMVGTLEQDRSIWGLVRSNDGTIHRVQPGNFMGQNHGQITRILDDRIEMTEIISDVQHGYIERSASLSLAEDESK
ncbi:hypothetical protein MNBD_GAMMA26-179 [hydrothermal vent metagenome]|uniref:Type IV pilus biogenesis protein PilP n=1 Tax=hydrothermal vent metagenome TaxID=652676 RepID=A0A3B1B2P4_9ZZZZ